MNWWIVAYIVLYLGLSFYSLSDDLTTKEPLWYVVLDVLCDVTAIALTYAYWFAPEPMTYGPYLLLAFIYSLSWHALTMPHELKKNEIDVNWKKGEDRILLLIGFTLVYGIMAPAYIWGGLLAWRYLQSLTTA